MLVAHDLAFTGLGDVAARRVEAAIESRPVLPQLGPAPLVLPEQHEERRRILPLQALLHLLRRDHRIVVVGDDAARGAAEIVQAPRAPRRRARRAPDEDDDSSPAVPS